MPRFSPRTRLERGMDHQVARQGHVREQHSEMQDTTEIESVLDSLQGPEEFSRELWDTLVFAVNGSTPDPSLKNYKKGDEYTGKSELLLACSKTHSSAELIRTAIQSSVSRIYYPVKSLASWRRAEDRPRMHLFHEEHFVGKDYRYAPESNDLRDTSEEADAELTHFLKEATPLFEHAPKLRREAVKALLDVGEAALLKDYFKKEHFSPEEVVQVFTGLIRTHAGFIGQKDFFEQLHSIEQTVEATPDWSNPSLQKALVEAYDILLRNPLVAGHWDRFLGLVKVSGVDPAQWNPPYGLLSSAVQEAYKEFLARGEVERAREMERFTKQPLSRSQEAQLVQSAFLALSDTMRFGIGSKSITELEATFGKKIDAFFESGGATFPVEKRLEILERTVENVINSAGNLGSVQALLSLEWFLHQLVDRIGIPQSCFSEKFSQGLRICFISHRYYFPFNFIERDQILKRIETFTGVSQPVLEPAAAVTKICQALASVPGPFLKEEGFNFNIQPYLAAHLPKLLALEPHPSQIPYLSYIKSAIEKGLPALAKLEGNDLFPEQIQAFKEVGIKINVSEEDKNSWLKRRVRAKGLLFDPFEGAERLNVSYRKGYEEELYEYEMRSISSSEDPEEISKEQFALSVLKAYRSKKVSGREFGALVGASEVAHGEKFRIIRALIHSAHLPDTNLAAVMGQEVGIVQRTRVHDLLELLLNLPFSEEEKNDLAQELYAAYLSQRGEFLDVGLLERVPPLDLTHPSIIAVRLSFTKQFIINHSITSLAQLSREKPVYLPVSQWSPEQRQEFTQLLQVWNAELLPELEQDKITRPETDQEFADRLEQLFSGQLGKGYIDARTFSQLFLVERARIIRVYKTSSSFQAVLDTVLAHGVGIGRWPLEYAEKVLSVCSGTFTPRSYEIVLRVATQRGAWQIVDEVLRRSPKGKSRLDQFFKKELGAAIWKFLKTPTNDQSAQSVAHVLFRFPEALIKEQQKPEFPWEGYQMALGYICEEEFVLIEDLLKAPGIKPSHPALQAAFAVTAISTILGSLEKPSGPEQAFINWSHPVVQDVLASEVLSHLPAFSQMATTPTAEPVLALKLLREVTGYGISDQLRSFLETARSLRELLQDFERWDRLVSLLGDDPAERGALQKGGQKRLDALCSKREGTVEEYLAMQKKWKLTPGDEALREYIVQSIYRGLILPAFELLRGLGRTVELSAEQISDILPGTPRVEALIYTLVLPKQGPERVAAEKAYRERSDLAALMPQLLAIQSPTKRPEFCPYDQALQPLLRNEKISLKEESGRRGLLLFLKEFGMQRLPQLLIALTDLVAIEQDPSRPREAWELIQLRELLEVGQEQWTIEQYIAKIHERMHTLHQAILEDKTIGPEIEHNPLAMELFNAIVPHVGSYQKVDDRSALLALTRVHEDALVVDSCYKPLSILVDVAEQERATVTSVAEQSPAERAIRLRRDQIAKKYQDETMLHFIGGWEESMKLMQLELTGSSSTYWFSIVRDRIESQIASLQKKKEGIENEKGKAAIEKKILHCTEISERLFSLMNQERDLKQQGVLAIDLLEELQSVFVNSRGKVDRVELESQAGDVARALTLVIMREHSPVHCVRVNIARTEQELAGEAEQSGGTAFSPGLLKAWETWFREEYLEHFAGFNPGVDVSLSTATRILLQKLWRIDGLEGDIEKMRAGEKEQAPMAHPLIGPFATIERLEQEISQLERTQRSGSQQSLQFWPVKKIGRVLAGDIANACYNARREALARGEEKKITALLMTIPGQVELAGSTLLIDTKTRSGRRVLVIRALNPTEAIIRKSLDAGAVVEATIEYAKQVALATQESDHPIREIRLCHDHTGGHSTNRSEIFEAEKALIKKHGWTTGKELENVSETNFNGYDIYPSNETRVVWRSGRGLSPS